MQFDSFVPTFILFFRKFKYYPPSISLIKLNFNNSDRRFFLLNNFSKPSNRLQYALKYKSIEYFFWNFNNLLPQESNIWNSQYFLMTPLSLNLKIQLYNWILKIMASIRFVMSFFCERLNKKLYKYSNYKRPRYSLKFFYIPRYKRLKTIFKFLGKSILFEKGNSYLSKICFIWNQFFLDVTKLYFYRYINFIQVRLLKLPRK